MRTKEVIEIAIKLGVLLLLLSWTFEIVRPFINPLLWSIILAVSLEPIYNRTLRIVKGRSKLAAFILITVFLILVLVPSYYLVRSAIHGVNELKLKYEAGELTIAEVDGKIAEIPLIGSPLHDLLTAMTTNLKGFLSEHEEQLVAAAKGFANALLGTGTGVLELLLALIIGIILLATPGTERASNAFFDRLAGNFGREFVKISQSTIRNVVKGVLGVAIIQSILIGLAFLLADIPYAGVWAIIVLVLSVIQLPPMLVTLPVIIYLFYTRSGWNAGLWTVVILLAGASDNVLKPYLMGRGATSPMLVIFLGSLGGFIAFGFIGLFLGAIVLALVYRLLLFWLDLNNTQKADTDSSPTELT